MTDNPTNPTDSEARHRVLGTPVDDEGAFTPALDREEPEQDHEGPYPAAETHDHSEERQRTGERMAAAWFVVAFLAGVGFLWSYFAFPPDADGAVIGVPAIGQLANLAMGGTLAISLFAIAAGMTVWMRRVMPQYEVASPYDEIPSTAEEKSSFGDFFMRGANESGFTRRPLLRRTLLLSMVPLGIAPIVLLRDAGPLPGDTLRHTLWEDGRRMVVEGSLRPVRSDDLAVGGMITVLPENTEDPEHAVNLTEQAKTVTMLIKMDPDDFGPEMTEERVSWTHDGIIAYSKVCTHVGCPAALYERTTHRILCPCHQSTFDAADAAKVVFGPAARPLPQLPIREEDGYLVAAGDYDSPVGPTFWDAEKED